MDKFEKREVTHETLSKLAKSIEERAYASKGTRRRPRVIVCECGARILLVPDLDEMAKSIEEHATEHERPEPTEERAEAEHCRIETLLAQRVLLALGH